MEEFEESGLLDEQDKVICVMYCDVVSIIGQPYISIIFIISLCT
jgi:hypothetical protein